MADDARELPEFRGSRPVPDPTQLTNELVAKATVALREILETRMDGLEARVVTSEAMLTRHVDIAIKTIEDLLSTKINANGARIEHGEKELADKFAAFSAIVDGKTKEREHAITALNFLLDEKIKALTETVGVFKTAVNERFQLGDVQTEKAARDVKSAVDAAFAAAKEAVGEQNKSNALSIAKSEVSTTKQLDQLAENLRLSVKTSDDKIGDLKDRIIAMEGQSKGTGQTVGWTIGMIAVVVSILSAVVTYVHYLPGPPTVLAPTR